MYFRETLRSNFMVQKEKKKKRHFTEFWIKPIPVIKTPVSVTFLCFVLAYHCKTTNVTFVFIYFTEYFSCSVMYTGICPSLPVYVE